MDLFFRGVEMLIGVISYGVVKIDVVNIYALTNLAERKIFFENLHAFFLLLIVLFWVVILIITKALMTNWVLMLSLLNIYLAFVRPLPSSTLSGNYTTVPGLSHGLTPINLLLVA